MHRRRALDNKARGGAAGRRRALLSAAQTIAARLSLGLLRAPAGRASTPAAPHAPLLVLRGDWLHPDDLALARASSCGHLPGRARRRPLPRRRAPPASTRNSSPPVLDPPAAPSPGGAAPPPGRAQTAAACAMTACADATVFLVYADERYGARRRRLRADCSRQPSPKRRVAPSRRRLRLLAVPSCDDVNRCRFRGSP